MNRDETLTNCGLAILRWSWDKSGNSETEPGSNSLVEWMIAPQTHKQFIICGIGDNKVIRLIILMEWMIAPQTH